MYKPVIDQSTQDEEDAEEHVNLNVLPLGAILSFIFVFCFKFFNWALSDIREWDEKNVEISVSMVLAYLPNLKYSKLHSSKDSSHWPVAISRGQNGFSQKSLKSA